MGKLGRQIAFALAFAGALFTMPSGGMAQTSAPSTKIIATKTFNVVAVEVNSVPLWLPSTINVEQGDHVRLILKNMMGGEPDVHGFSIPAYNIAVLLPHGATKSVEFTANKVGIFPFVCQIHGNHIGGQIVVQARQ